MNDIEVMLSDTIQEYYGSNYLSYQKYVIAKNDKFSEDNLMINRFITGLSIKGTLVDIGSGNCRWFPLFENYLSHYYGIDINDNAISLSPEHTKLTTLNKNVFQEKLQFSDLIKLPIDIVLFSFFLSHFSDFSIQKLITKLEDVNSIIIIDSFWGNRHKEKYLTKELRDVKRMTSQNEYIKLPKRFFEYTDIDNLFKPFGYIISKFERGHYSFICTLTKTDTVL